MSLEDIEKTSVAEVKQRLHDREHKYTIPPAHIVSGECTWAAFSDYIAHHPVPTLRARDVAQMCLWMQPLINAQQQQSWGIGDIIKPDSSEH